jgi:hypothetical protein
MGLKSMPKAISFFAGSLALTSPGWVSLGNLHKQSETQLTLHASDINFIDYR